MRTASTSFFRYFTNGFRRAFAYVRTLASSTLNAGVEQRKKIEQAQIGFASFFGEDNVAAVTSKIRSEAAKTPIVDAGALAEYVQQLAPVSKGNANSAINASLGILKALVYSGSDISEGEYVIKNIRDVIAKGKGTAIDIRQFNRALPGLETALKKAGLTEFLNKEGQLTINKKNVGKVLDLFATLNTDENSPLKDIEEKQLKETLESFKGKYMQEVPLYSSVKVNGKRLYKYAREKEEVILPKREVEIYNIELLSLKDDEFTFKTTVSKGTYIRSLIRDIGDKINIPCSMKDLQRTKQGMFDIKDSVRLEDLKKKEYKIFDVDYILSKYDMVVCDNYLERRVRNGSILDNRYNTEYVVYKDKNNEVIAIYKVYDKDNTKVKPYKVLKSWT